MPPLIPLFLTIAIIVVLFYVAWQLISTYDHWGTATVKMLFTALLIIVAIFILAALIGTPLLVGLRLK